LERFGFDPELLYLARRHGLRAVEIPVRWGHSPATKVSMLRDSFNVRRRVYDPLEFTAGPLSPQSVTRAPAL